MEKPKVNFENYVALMENSLKEKAIIAPYIRGNRVVDFGAGSGSFLTYLKTLDPNYTTIGVDNDNDMRLLIKARGTVDAVYSTLSEVEGGIDTIIFNSVLHEVYSYGDRAGRRSKEYMKEVKDVLKEAREMLLAKGRIIIRDGFLTGSRNQIAARIKDKSFDVDAYIENYPYGTRISRRGDIVTGPFDDMKEFLNKLSWGNASISREIEEKINFLTPQEWDTLLKECGYTNITIITYTQPSYFFYLQKVAEIEKMWPTHILITAERGEK